MLKEFYKKCLGMAPQIYLRIFRDTLTMYKCYFERGGLLWVLVMPPYYLPCFNVKKSYSYFSYPLVGALFGLIEQSRPNEDKNHMISSWIESSNNCLKELINSGFCGSEYWIHLFIHWVPFETASTAEDHTQTLKKPISTSCFVPTISPHKFSAETLQMDSKNSSWLGSRERQSNQRLGLNSQEVISSQLTGFSQVM